MRTPDSDTSEEKREPPSPKRPTQPNPRVEKLRKQYRNGTYQVDAAKVSAKIIDEHLEK